MESLVSVNASSSDLEGKYYAAPGECNKVTIDFYFAELEKLKEFFALKTEEERTAWFKKTDNAAYARAAFINTFLLFYVELTLIRKNRQNQNIQ